jgi:hypothetical protein
LWVKVNALDQAERGGVAVAVGLEKQPPWSTARDVLDGIAPLLRDDSVEEGLGRLEADTSKAARGRFAERSGR